MSRGRNVFAVSPQVGPLQISDAAKLHRFFFSFFSGQGRKDFFVQQKGHLCYTKICLTPVTGACVPIY